MGSTVQGKVTAVRVRFLAQGRLSTHTLSEAKPGIRTSNLPVTGQPDLPPEPHAALPVHLIIKVKVRDSNLLLRGTHRLGCRPLGNEPRTVGLDPLPTHETIGERERENCVSSEFILP